MKKFEPNKWCKLNINGLTYIGRTKIIEDSVGNKINVVRCVDIDGDFFNIYWDNIPKEVKVSYLTFIAENSNKESTTIDIDNFTFFVNNKYSC